MLSDIFLSLFWKFITYELKENSNNKVDFNALSFITAHMKPKYKNLSNFNLIYFLMEQFSMIEKN